VNIKVNAKVNKMVSKEEMINLLNNDLKLEYSAAIQYINHSALMTGAQFTGIIKELKVHATEEMQHAQTLADQIAFLGGKPAIDVGEVKVSDDNVEMLNQDFAGELDAIERYKMRIQEAEELQEYALAHQLRNILSMEQEHAMDLQEALGK